MLEQIKSKMQEEETQRAILHATGLVVTFVATQMFSSMMNRGIEVGINKLMEKLHTTVEIPAE